MTAKRYQYADTQNFWTLQDQTLLDSLLKDRAMDPGSEDFTGVARASRVSMLKPGPGTEWLFRKISQALQIHNERFYGYKLEFVQDLQYTEYPEGEGYYGAHQDWGSAVYNGRDDLCRKLSFTIQLSDPSTYDGGDLHIYYGEDFTLEAQRLRAQGTLITFPSFMLHEVKPVTRGIRRSLVGWCMGPDYQ